MEAKTAMQERLLELMEKLNKLDTELASRERVLSEMIEEKNLLMQKLSLEPSEPRVGAASEHFRYTMPLVDYVHQLWLKEKEQGEKLNELEMASVHAFFGQKILALSLEDHECVLKKWSKELRVFSSKGNIHKEETVSDDSIVSNIAYNCEHHDKTLYEDLGFTVLCKGVHLRAVIISEMPCPSIHIIRRTKTMIGITTDTFVPGLQEKVKTSLSEGKPVTDVVQLMSQYIRDEMAPFAIIVPTRKGKGKESKPRETKSPKKVTHESCDKKSDKRPDSPAN